MYSAVKCIDKKSLMHSESYSYKYQSKIFQHQSITLWYTLWHVNILTKWLLHLHWLQIALAVEEGNDGKFPRELRRAEHQEMPSRKWEGRLSIAMLATFFIIFVIFIIQKIVIPVIVIT